MARFMRKGITRLYFVPTITTPTAPSTAQIIAGTRLDTQIAEINGFMFENNPIDTPDMATAFVSKIPGEDTVGDSDLTFYEDKTTNPIKTALVKNTVGYVVIYPVGPVGGSPASGDKVEVWPAIVASNSRIYTAGNEAARYRVVFSLNAEPNIDVTAAA